MKFDLVRPTRKPRSSTSTSADAVPWFRLDLFAPATAQAGSRFDDTVALPVDTPRRLEAVLEAATLRLRALPASPDLSHRTLAYRARLQQIVRETAAARQRLDDGTYGTCATCAEPIALAPLTRHPWRRACIRCALDL